MARDFDVDHPATSPAFFFHLGDVIYGDLKDQAYRREFYEPYRHYPGKIIAIPGNHDGEVFPKTDPKTLKAFLKNFCAAKALVPPIAGTIFRQTMTQPGVFWLLDTPFAHIIGLYSNVAENPGFISGKIPGKHQKAWLVETLKRLAELRTTEPRKALVFAAHHPPFSSAGHAGSHEMLADIDDACTKGGLMPDVSSRLMPTATSATRGASRFRVKLWKSHIWWSVPAASTTSPCRKLPAKSREPFNRPLAARLWIRTGGNGWPHSRPEDDRSTWPAEND